jgi:hypothetical protein
MPYFLYKVFPNKKLELIEDFGKYKEAKDRARQLRAEMGNDDSYIVKMIHAKHTEEAKRLLSQERKPRPMGEDA